jgi:hypothetical protein
MQTFRRNILSPSSVLKWGCWAVGSLYRVRKRTRLGGIGQPESRNEKETVWANTESSHRETEWRAESGERERKRDRKTDPFWGNMEDGLKEKFRMRPRDWDEIRDGPGNRQSQYWEPERKAGKGERNRKKSGPLRGPKGKADSERSLDQKSHIFPLSLSLPRLPLRFLV